MVAARRRSIRVIKPADDHDDALPPARESRVLADVRLGLGQRRDIMISRINVGVYAPPRGGTTRIRSAPNGFPDLICTQLKRVWQADDRSNKQAYMQYTHEGWFYYGHAIAIETKRLKNGKQSDAQKAFQAAFEAVGGVYILARSFDDVIAVVGEEPANVQDYIERKLR